MLRTRICELLGIEHPVISAPMAGTATATLAAAVSEAGGFGLIGAGLNPDPSWVRDQIQTARELTSRPFGVGFISSAPDLEEIVKAALDEKVAAVSHSFVDPTPFIQEAHASGVKVLAQVQTMADAKAAVDAGADIITAQGSEAGGHTGHLGTLSFVLAVLDIAGEIPVVAAGGIADGRGLAAALMMGADAAWIGPRFVASNEWAGAEWIKGRVVSADADDTILTKVFDLASNAPFPLTIGDRVLRNNFTETWHGREAEVIARQGELQEEIATAAATEDASIAPVRAGNSSGLISGVEPAGDIVLRIVAEAEQVLRNRPDALLGR